MRWLRQSTAVVISFGPFVDKTDGNTWETGLVSALDHASTGIFLSKNGGTLTIRHATVTASTYDAYGCYKVTLDVTDTNTLGHLKIVYGDNNTTAVPVWEECMVVPAMIYDSVILGSDRLDTNVTHVADTAQTARDLGAAIGAFTGSGANTILGMFRAILDETTSKPSDIAAGTYNPATGSLPAFVSTAIDAPTLVDNVWDEALSGHSTAGTSGKALFDSARVIRTGTAQAGAATTITLDASASAVNSFYNNTLILITSGTGAGQARFITAYVGSTKVATVATWATNPDSTSVFQIIPFDAVAGATAPTAAQVATAVWQDLLAGSDFGTALSIGALLKLDIDAAISSRLAPTVAARTLDVSATGEAGIDLANVGAPTTTLNLTNTTIKNVTDNATAIAAVQADTDNIQTRIPAALVAGRMDSSVGAMATGVVTAAAVADGAIDRATFAADTGLQPIRSATAQAGSGTTITLDASSSSIDDFYNNNLLLIISGLGVGQSRFITDYVGSTKVATVATWSTNPDNSSVFAILPFDSIAGATVPTASQVATAVWQDLLAGSDFATAASIGKLLKDDIDATISSRGTQTDLDAVPTNAELATALGTADDATLAQIALLKTILDKLDTAMVVDGPVYKFTVNALEDAPSGTGASAASIRAEMDANSTRLASIDGKTVNLPGTPAAVGSAMTLAANSVNASALATDAVAEIVAAIKAIEVENQGAITLGQAMSVILSVCAGVTSGNGLTFKSPNGIATRAAITVDSNQNRTSAVLTPST